MGEKVMCREMRPFHICQWAEVILILFLVTACGGELRLLQPKKDHPLMAYQPVAICWEGDESISFVKLEYSVNNGYNWILIESNVPNNGFYVWIAPPHNSELCLIKLSDAANSNVYDISDEPLTIYSCQRSFFADFVVDCYVDLKDLLQISQNWLGPYSLEYLAQLSAEWLTCGNPFDPFCGSYPAPTIEQIVSDVNQDFYTFYQQSIEDMGLGLYGGPAYNQGYRNRDHLAGQFSGSLGNYECQLYLISKLTEMGLNVSIVGNYQNIVAELPGKITPEKIYLLGAHYDHINYLESKRNSFCYGEIFPGGDDNASGVAGVLEAARVLSQYRFESTIRFVFFNAEEDPPKYLYGSRDYVSKVIDVEKRDGKILAGVICMDMILRPGSDLSPPTIWSVDLDLLIRQSDCAAWADKVRGYAASFVPYLLVDATTEVHFNDIVSDHTSFDEAGYNAVLLREMRVSERSHNLYRHTSEDWRGGKANNGTAPYGVKYDYAFATNVVRVAVATIASEAVPVGW